MTISSHLESSERNDSVVDPCCKKVFNWLSLCDYEMSDEETEMVEVEGDSIPAPLEEKLMEYVKKNLMGHQSTFKGPFGRKQVVYADMNSTGRSLRFLEDFVMSEILPVISDSNSMTTVTGLQTAMFLDETRYGEQFCCVYFVT